MQTLQYKCCFTKLAYAMADNKNLFNFVFHFCHMTVAGTMCL